MGLVPAAMAGSLRQTSSSAPRAGGHLVAEVEHFAELEAGVDVQEREGNGPGEEGFLGKAQHDRGVFADGVEHDGALELACNLAQNVDAFGFEQLQMREGRWGRQGIWDG